MQEKVYCRCCGQLCQPVKTKQPAENYDPPGCQGRLVEEFVSDCCHDAISDVPVTDQCARCGRVATRAEAFPEIGGTVLCPNCFSRIGED